jgi:hypothetical protein
MGQKLRMQGKYWMTLAGDEKKKKKQVKNLKPLHRLEKREVRRKMWYRGKSAGPSVAGP